MLTPSTPPARLRDKSGTITNGGVSQLVWNESDRPKWYLLFQNVSDTDMWLGFDTDAVANKGILVKAGWSYESPAGIMFGAVMNVLCATTGKAFVCSVC